MSVESIPIEQIEDFFPDFTNIEEVEAGGQGVVYKVVNEQGESRALKIFPSSQSQVRAKREVEALSRVRSDNILHLLDFGTKKIEEREIIFTVSDYVDGENLRALISREENCSKRLVRKVCLNISDAIQACWDQNIVHRDIKPSNILISETGSVVLADLGAAKILDLESITATGATYGTIGYLSPEQCSGNRLTLKSDIFSLGITCRELLLGCNDYMTLHQPNWTEPESLVSHLSNDGLLERVIDNMLNLQAYSRPLPDQIIQKLQR